MPHLAVVGGAASRRHQVPIGLAAARAVVVRLVSEGGAAGGGQQADREEECLRAHCVCLICAQANESNALEEKTANNELGPKQRACGMLRLPRPCAFPLPRRTHT